MTGCTYPVGRAIKIAKEIVRSASSKYPEVLEDPCFHDFEYLQRICHRWKIRLLADHAIPGGRKKGILLDVNGTPFIILDSSLSKRKEDSQRTLAHEIAHFILHYNSRLSFRIAGYSETMNQWDASLQVVYRTETELEADLLGMMLLMTDRFLGNMVEQTTFIPVRAVAHKYGLDTKWVIARVQLYRAMYGYDRSKELLRMRLKNELFYMDPAKWFGELGYGGVDYLRPFLPEVDSKLLPYLT